MESFFISQTQTQRERERERRGRGYTRLCCVGVGIEKHLANKWESETDSETRGS